MNEFQKLKVAAERQVFSAERFHRSENAELCADVVALRSNLRWLEPHVLDNESTRLPFAEIVKNVEQIEDHLAQSQGTIRDCRSKVVDHIGALEIPYVDLLLQHNEMTVGRQAATQHAINDPAVRAAVLQLTGGRCAYCDCELEQGTGTTETFTVEHIVPRESGGPDNIANYVPACKSCNCSKGTGHVITFIKRRVSLAAGVRPELRLVPTEIAGG